jgi:hypothetical protein
MHILLQPDQYQNYPSQTYPGQGYPGADPSILHHMSLSLQESVYRVLALLVSLLPGLLAFILAVGLLSLIGMGVSWVLRKILIASKFDERLARNRASGIADWAPSHSPTALVGRVAFWTCVILGLVVGIYSLDVSYSATGSLLSTSLLPYLTHAVGAVLLLFFGNLIARFLARTVLIGAVNNGFTYARFLSMGVKWLVLVLTAAMVLDHLQIGGAIIELAFGILFGGIVLTLSLAIGLGSRDLVSRSLDRVTDRTPPYPNDPADFEPPVARTPAETLRHF